MEGLLLLFGGAQKCRGRKNSSRALDDGGVDQLALVDKGTPYLIGPALGVHGLLQPLRPGQLLRLGRKRFVDRSDLLGMNRRFAVEAHLQGQAGFVAQAWLVTDVDERHVPSLQRASLVRPRRTALDLQTRAGRAPNHLCHG